MDYYRINIQTDTKAFKKLSRRVTFRSVGFFALMLLMAADIESLKKRIKELEEKGD